METTTDRQALLAELRYVAATVPSRPVVPVLGGVRIDTSDGVIGLVTTDYEVWTAAHLDATVDTAGTVVVGARMLRDMVAKTTGDRVDLVAHDRHLAVSDGEVAYTLQRLPDGDFPQPPDPDGDPVALIPDDVLRDMARVTVAADRGPWATPNLSSVILDAPDGRLDAACTDRYRIAMHASDVPADLDEGMLVPRPVFERAARELSGKVALTVHGGHVRLADGTRSLDVRTVDGSLPHYRSLVPTEFTRHVAVDTKPLTKAVDQVKVAAERNIPLEFQVGTDRIVVGAQTGDEFTASKSVDAHADGSIRVGLKPGYVTEGVKVLGADRVTVGFTTETGPALMWPAAEDRPALTYLLMPHKLGDQ